MHWHRLGIGLLLLCNSSQGRFGSQEVSQELLWKINVLIEIFKKVRLEAVFCQCQNKIDIFIDKKYMENINSTRITL